MSKLHSHRFPRCGGEWYSKPDVDARIRDLEAALAVAEAECFEARTYTSHRDTGTAQYYHRDRWLNAVAVTDANELIRQYRASKEQAR